MFYNKVDVKVIVLAVYNMERAGLNSQKILLNSIAWLVEQYEITQDDSYLKKAVWHIYAYLELGYPYEGGTYEFDKVLEYLNQDAETLFPKEKWGYKKISLTKANVNQLLGKWNPHFQSMKIDDAVLDIVDKIRNKECGEFPYHCGKIIEQHEEKTLWEKTFILRITKTEAILQDVNRSKYYMFNEVTND